MSEPLIYVFIFIFGLGIGSFLNVVIYRIEQGMDMVRLRSHCINCKHVLNAVDLIPLFGFFIRLGRCKYCTIKISWQYPFVELATGLLFLLMYARYLPGELSLGSVAPLLYLFFVGSILISIAVYDFNYFIIPDIFTYLLAGTAVLYQFLLIPLGLVPVITEDNIFHALIGAGIGGGLFLFFHLVSKGAWMGFGDVKLGFALGVMLGLPLILEALILSFVIGGIIGAILILTKKKAMKSQIPFGPFLALSAIIVVLWGKEILALYMGYFL